MDLLHIKKRTFIETTVCKPIRNNILFDGGNICDAISHAVFRYQGNPAIPNLILWLVNDRLAADCDR